MQNQYESIIIGAGLGGLTTAAWLAKAGKKVLLIEKEPRVGGYFGPVVHGGYFFNNGPRLLLGCNADGPFGPGITYKLIEQLGVAQQCEFLPQQPFTTVCMPDLEFQLFSGRQAYIEGLNSAIPGAFPRLPELLDLYGRIHQAGMSYYAANRPWGLPKIAGQIAGALRYQYATVEDVLAHYFPQARPRSLVEALWSYLGLPPRQASFIYWAVLMASYIDEGAYFCKGGLHQLPLAVANAFQRDGGELLVGSSVEHILVQDRKVRGVQLADGRQFFAPDVIANIDPRQVFGELITPEQRPLSYLRKLNKMELSVQSINLSLVTDLDLPAIGYGYETLLIDGWDAGRVWQDLEAGQISMFSLTRMDAADPGMAPPGRHLVNLFCNLPTTFDPSPLNVQRSTAALLEAAEQRLPGLKDHLLPPTTVHGQSPLPAYRTSLLEPIYGWASVPRYAALLRLSPLTPVRGLTLTGQWTRPGQGASGVIMSGLEAARRLLR
jgi:all-trans-retinol 13,14-reductase